MLARRTGTKACIEALDAMLQSRSRQYRDHHSARKAFRCASGTYSITGAGFEQLACGQKVIAFHVQDMPFRRWATTFGALLPAMEAVRVTPAGFGCRGDATIQFLIGSQLKRPVN